MVLKPGLISDGKTSVALQFIDLEKPNYREIWVPILPATPRAAQFPDGKWHEVATTADLYCFVLFISTIAESS